MSHTLLSKSVNKQEDNKKYFWAPNQHIRMISEWSCDTEDWSNNAENSALESQQKIAFYNIYKN